MTNSEGEKRGGLIEQCAFGVAEWRAESRSGSELREEKRRKAKTMLLFWS